MTVPTIHRLKLFSLIIASALAVSLPQAEHTAFAATTTTAKSEANILINGILANQSTLAPLRQFAESLGFTVEWHAETQSVTVSKDGKTIQLTLHQPIAYVNGKAVNLELVPLLHRDKTVVPVRFISEAFGANVQWDNTNRRVIINDRIMILIEPDDRVLFQMIESDPNGPVGNLYLRPQINFVDEETIKMNILIPADSSNSREPSYTTYTFTRSHTGWSIAKVEIEQSNDIEFQLNENEAIYLTWRTTTDTIVKAHGSYAFSPANNNMKWDGDSFMFTTQTPEGNYRTVLVNIKTGRTADFASFKHEAPQIKKTLGP